MRRVQKAAKVVFSCPALDIAHNSREMPMATEPPSRTTRADDPNKVKPHCFECEQSLVDEYLGPAEASTVSREHENAKHDGAITCAFEGRSDEPASPGVHNLWQDTADFIKAHD